MTALELMERKLAVAEREMSAFLTNAASENAEVFAREFVDAYEGEPPYERWRPTPEEKKFLERKRRLRRKG